MSLLAPVSAPPTTGDRKADAARQLEALVLRQMLSASGAFKPSDAPGASLHTDLFVDALADAVSRAGGIGLARTLEHAMGAAAESPPPGSAPTASGATQAGASSGALPTWPSPLPGTAAKAAVLDAGSTVTSGFGPRIDPLDGHLAHHAGVDLAAPAGTEVRAAAAGVVKEAGERGGYGLAVEIDHGGGVTTVYGHASELLVRAGEKVQPGQPIAKVGHTGRATGDHLHFELRRSGVAVNPTTLLKAYAGRADSIGGRSTGAPSGSTS
ncbi:MAG TPA: peptidoglycan DD-metalloendopeptidase family protein [Myxococcaceae bacterium]|nr:peptidoglycan DD-metalloendopeptidase family protein [Myxococcaceae bacterium]